MSEIKVTPWQYLELKKLADLCEHFSLDGALCFDEDRWAVGVHTILGYLPMETRGGESHVLTVIRVTSAKDGDSMCSCGNEDGCIGVDQGCRCVCHGRDKCPTCGNGVHGVDPLCDAHYREYLGTHRARGNNEND